MAAPKKNQFWKLKNQQDHTPITDPGQLWQAACQYFEWCDKHPWTSTRKKIKTTGDETAIHPIQRPYTLSGIHFYAGVNEEEWNTLRRSPTLSPVVTAIEQVIRTQQYEGAAVGAYQATIARRLESTEKTNPATDEQTIIWHEEKTYEAQ